MFKDFGEVAETCTVFLDALCVFAVAQVAGSANYMLRKCFSRNQTGENIWREHLFESFAQSDSIIGELLRE